MIFSPASNDPERGRTLAYLLSLLRQPDAKAQLDAYVGAELAVPIQSLLVAGAIDCPTFYWAYGAGKTVVFVGGCETNAQGAAFAAGLAGAGFLIDNDPVNNYCRTAGRKINNIADPTFNANNDLTLLVGYSLGGAIAETYAVMLLERGLSGGLEYVTFGSPKTLGPTDANALTRIFGARWMTAEDPVPLIPLTFEDAPAQLLVVGARTLMRLGKFVHPAGGISLPFGQAAIESVLPTNITVKPSIAIGTWMAGYDSAGDNPHSLALYQQRLVGYRDILAASTARATPGAPVQAPVDTTAAIVAGEVRVAEATLFRIAADRENAGVFIQPGLAFTCERRGNTWMVLFSDNVFALAPTKRRARHLKNLGNQFLACLQIQASVDPTAFQETFADYLIEASAPDGGFLPVMNTKLPFIMP